MRHVGGAQREVYLVGEEWGSVARVGNQFFRIEMVDWVIEKSIDETFT